jgi:Fur family ferric uptake transcriptional regulator
MSDGKQLTGVERWVQDRLAESGVRFTRGRRAVVRDLQQADGPRSAAEIHRSVADRVPLSSLYRTLSVLEGCGVVVPHHGLRGTTRYELAESIRGHHHHLVCSSCGAVDDVALDHDTEKELARLVAEVAAAGGLDPRSHTLEVEGRCRRC